MGCIVSRHSSLVRPQHPTSIPVTPATSPAPTTNNNSISTTGSDQQGIVGTSTSSAHEVNNDIHISSHTASFPEPTKTASNKAGAHLILRALIQQPLNDSSTTPSQTALLDSSNRPLQNRKHHQSTLEDLQNRLSHRTQALITREAQLRECHEQLNKCNEHMIEQTAMLQDMTKQLEAQGATIQAMTGALGEATEALKGRDEEIGRLRAEREELLERERGREGQPYWVFEGGYRVNWA